MTPLAPLRAWPRRQLLSALGLLIVAQLLGLLLRLQFVRPLAGVNYGFFLHAHSHVALLGWLHALLLITLPRAFLPAGQSLKAYDRIFWCSQLTVLGMLLSFPVQGYAAVSITFSTLSLFCIYAFVYCLLRDTRQTQQPLAAQLSFQVLRWSLWLLVLSTLGPWSLGPIMALKLNQQPVYYLAIYFYLHFQYNAWFLLGALALALRWLESEGQRPGGGLRLAVRCLCWSSLPTLALSALWLKPALWVWLLGGAGALLQLFALLAAWQAKNSWYLPVCHWLREQPQHFWLKVLLGISLLCLHLKVLLQAFTALPYFAALAAEQRPLIIVYLHLVLLGVLTCFWLAKLLPAKPTRFQHLALGCFVTGFVLSEGLLLYQGLSQAWLGQLFHSFFVCLLAVSGLMPLGLSGFLVVLQLSANRQAKGF